ncbi:hypothetical protein Esti_001776 [Eimeria stiedai]
MARKKRSDEAAAAAAGNAASGSGLQRASGPQGKGVEAAEGSASQGGGGGPQPSGRQKNKGGGSSGGAAAPKSAPVETTGGGPPSEAQGGGARAGLAASSPQAEKRGPSGDRWNEEKAGGGGGASGGEAGGSSEGRSSPERTAVNMAGLSSSQKKNLKRKLRKQEQKQQEAALHSALQVGAGAASLASRLSQHTQKWGRRLAEIESSSKGGSVKHVLEAADQLKKEMQEAVDEEVGRAKNPINKRASVQQVQEKIRNVELTIQKQQKELQRSMAQDSKADGGGGGKSPDQWTLQSQVEESRRYLGHLKEQLLLTQQQSDLRAFQQQASEIKASLDAVVKQAQKAAQQQASSGGGDARRFQQKEEAWRKRLQELGAAAPAGGGSPASFVTHSLVLPSEASVVLLTPQGQPSMMLRKVERKFSVLVEKRGTNERGVSLTVVAYTQDACDKCASFLSACNFPQVPLGFETAPNCVSLQGQNIGAFIGTSGSNLRKLEAELDVLLWLEDKWITVLGHEEAVKNAVPHLKEARSPPSGGEASATQHRVELKAEAVRAMTQGSAATRAHLLDLEKKLGVTVVARAPRRGAPTKTATVSVRGSDPEACKRACAQLEETFEAFDAQAVECDRAKASRILRGEVVDFSKIPNNELISLLRCDEGVLVVCQGASLPAAVEAVEAAMQQLSRVSETLEVKATQLRILDRAKRSEIEGLSGATCRPPAHEGEKAFLTFTGHPDAVQKAIQMAQQILEEQKEEEVELSTAAAMLFLVEKAHRALEEEHNIRIRVDVPRERLMVWGAGGREAVAEAVRKIEEEVVNGGKVAVKVDVPREAVPLILGRQGANLRRIQSDCNLDNMVIDGRPQAVFLLGSQEAVDQASAMVQETVAASSSGGGPRQMNGLEGGMGERRPRGGAAAARLGRGGGRSSEGGPRGGATVGAGGRGRGGARGGAATTANSKPYEENVNDENAFPSLGVCMTRPGGRWQKRSPAAPEQTSDVVACAASGEARGGKEVEAEPADAEASLPQQAHPAAQVHSPAAAAAWRLKDSRYQLKLAALVPQLAQLLAAFEAGAQ